MKTKITIKCLCGREIEFLLVAIELVAIQEKTNYPTGTLTESLYKNFGVKDRFSVIQRAVWRG